MREGFRVYWRLSHSTRTRRRLQEFITGLASRALSILELPERKAFLEKEIERSFGFRRVENPDPSRGPRTFFFRKHARSQLARPSARYSRRTWPSLPEPGSRQRARGRGDP